jgi:glycosyltransferase involved in cell wall biosynthesis
VPTSAAVVVQDHASGDPPKRNPLVNAIRRRLMRGTDGFLFSVIEQAAPWRQCGFIAVDQRVHAVMEASTDLRPLPRAAARAASGVTGAPAVLWVGRLNANKDPVTVIDAFERFAGAVPGATLTMVYQETDLLATVRARVQAAPLLSDRVRLVGEVARARIAAYFSAADLFVVGSHHEGSGYAVIEALACGAIPVVTTIPTFRALTGEGAIGALWQAGDVDACARALTEISARDLAIERHRVIDHFQRELTWSALGARAIAIYGAIRDARALHGAVRR